jgi:hypothetical protein
MASIAAIARDFKNHPQDFLPETLIRDAAAGHAWRQRVLGPVLTVHLMVLQVLHANVSGRGLLRIAGLAVSDTAYFNARARLPIDVLGRVLFALTHPARQQTAPGSNQGDNFRGHRVFTIDGSGVSMPDVPALRKAFGVPGRVAAGLGFPVMHTLWMFDHVTGLLIDFITAHGHTHDLTHAHRFHALLGPGDLLLGDRAFGSFAHIALLLQQNLHGVFRAHQRLIVDFTAGRKRRTQRPKGQRRGAPASRQIKRLGEEDQVVAWIKPAACPAWMTAEQYADLPATVTVRELRYRVNRRGFRTTTVTLVTTLLDPEVYPKEELAELYRTRWTIETNLRHLKQTMGMGVLRSKSVDGVKKELLAYAIAYNLVRLRMLDEARRRGVAPDRVCFTDALDAVCHGTRTPLRINAHRPGRDEPRVIKRPKDHHTYMTKPRDQLRQDLGITRHAA